MAGTLAVKARGPSPHDAGDRGVWGHRHQARNIFACDLFECLQHFANRDSECRQIECCASTERAP